MRKVQFWLIAWLLCWSGCDGCLPLVAKTLAVQPLVAQTLAAQTLSAQTGSFDIDGPAEVAPGQLVRLTAEIEPAESPFWIVLEPVDLDYEQIENGRRLLFAVGCGQTSDVTVMLLAQRVVEDRIVTRQLMRTIKVNELGESPSGPEPPTPNPPLTELPVYQAVLAAWSQIPSSAAKSKSLEVAGNFELVARQCKTNELVAIPQIWQSLAARNAQTLAPLTGDWEVVGLALQAEFKKLGLATVKEHAIHLEAAALAIRTGHQHE